MSYLALYRKYRPAAFDEVRGQDHIVTTLKNQMAAGRIGHAYLFCGTRGTGKTSIAKLFAKAVNCESPVNGSPCGVCPVCKNIENHTSMNVIEIDAASNNGVDNIRDIVEEVRYSPTEGKYKVYIIDEVHMLSGGAFNALLKTLEEPPSYVIFILATTEVHKIPITILSRCQRYDFKRISVDTIAEWLRRLMDKEGIDAEEKALRYVAKAADGSMRDAQSLLDQCIAFYLGQTLTYEKVLEVLGTVDVEVFARMFRMIRQQRVDELLATLDEIVLQGREMSLFVTDFAWYLRNLLVAKTAKHPEAVLEFSKEQLEIILHEASTISEDKLIRYIRVLSELSNQIRYSAQKRLLVEIALIKLCKPEMEKDMDSLRERIENIEQQIESGKFAVKTDNAAALQEKKNIIKEPIKLDPATKEDLDAVARSWSMIVSQMSGAKKICLDSARPVSFGGKKLVIIAHDGVDVRVIEDRDKDEIPQGLIKLHDIIAELTGKDVELEVQSEENKEAQSNCVDIRELLNSEIGMLVQITD